MVNGTKIENTIGELIILLLYLTRFREKEDKVWRSWKGYDFTVLNKLMKDGDISFSYHAKSVYLEEKGIERAKKLLKKYKLSE
ncbi:MAG: DUF6429 family protein [Patescibacteria group bacterium]|nr:DUF6429 family protein [Patescibacteria group bacterium]